MDDLRLPLQFLILWELQTKQTGTMLAQAIGARRGEQILTPGTIYPTLKELHKKRLIKYRSKGREKHYVLSKKGEDELAKQHKQYKRAFKDIF